MDQQDVASGSSPGSAQLPEPPQPPLEVIREQNENRPIVPERKAEMMRPSRDPSELDLVTRLVNLSGITEDSMV